ncbi:MAG TPA: NAD(P)H-hydrate epimerase, partial [Gemmatimonadaceae bacterium]|nr:NAD(P)H-hydrate epimerase [Gemmatimonadaceae bacterium]
MPVRVVSAGESAARDQAAIQGGAPSRTLMQRAGKAAARQIIGRFGDRLYPGVTVFAGPGNNGGDGWV